ncbi:MAG: hypothetical protein F6K17_17100 [Okeania sp. SIO3C4]|nr:hypothetical protein [Okeania sp. SIO3C4]
MSEYQQYEFRSIDRKLTPKEKKEISQWSSRTEASDYSATFIYHYGDFRQDEIEAVANYFDAMTYMSNWGTRQLIFKIPKELSDAKRLRSFMTDGISIFERNGFTLINIIMGDEDGEGFWIEDERMMEPLFNLRQSILDGDFRSLYLLWLKFNIEPNEYSEQTAENHSLPVPSGLNNLDDAHTTLAEIFEIDSSIIEAASEFSGDETADETDYQSAIRNLSAEEKNRWLEALLENTPLLSEKFRRELKKEPQQSEGCKVSFEEVGEKATEIKERKKKAQQKLRKEQELRRLAKLEKQAPDLWREVDALISMKKANAYDDAIKILKKLKDLAKHKGEIGSFVEKVKEIQQKWSRLSYLQQKITYAKLI